MNLIDATFIAFVLGTAAIVIGLVYRSAGSRRAIGTLVFLIAWFTYVAALSHFGVLQRTDARPPGMLFILGPVVAYVLTLTAVLFTAKGARLAAAAPLAVLIGLQAFRIVVELFIHALYIDGIVPKMLTFSGANVDIYVGLSAPVIAVVAARYRHSKIVALVWNGLGLLALANVVVRAILTAPGPLNFLHADPPNRMFMTFPFMLIPAFFVPLAVSLHLLAIRANLGRRNADPPP